MFKITLRTARELNGYTVEEVAECSGIPIGALSKYEVDSEWMPLSLISKVLTLYGVSSSLIYFGTEHNCVTHNRKPPRVSGVTKG